MEKKERHIPNNSRKIIPTKITRTLVGPLEITRITLNFKLDAVPYKVRDERKRKQRRQYC